MQQLQPTLQLLLLLLVAMATQVNASGFWNSQYATKDFSRARYQCQYPIIIFQHVTNNQSFYSAPLVQLDHHSGNVIFNSLTGFYELRFHVLMWNHYIREFVKNHLKNEKNVKRPDVKLLPMEKSRFTWSSTMRMKNDLLLEEGFMSMNPAPDKLTLKMAGRNRTYLEEVQRLVQRHPDVLDSLELQSFVTSKKAARKTVTVTLQNLMKSNTFADFRLLPPDRDYRYMKSDDFNTLVQETYSSVRASTIREGEFMDKSDELNIVNLIQNALKQDEVFASALTATQWDSVFWNPLFTRPDKVTHVANKTFTRDASDGSISVNREFLDSNAEARDLFNSHSGSWSSKRRRSGSSHGWFHGSHWSDETESQSSHSSQSREKTSKQSLKTGKISDQQLNKLLREQELYVEWTGEKFIPRPLKLARINKRSFESRRDIVSESLQLNLYQQTLALKVQIARNQSIDGCSQTDGETAGFRGSSGSRSSSSSASSSSSSASSASSPLLPGVAGTNHSYCLLSNGGSCPLGFTRSHGHAIGFRTSPGEVPTSVKPGQLGDSSISCVNQETGRNERCSASSDGAFEFQLHLFVCCK